MFSEYITLIKKLLVRKYTSDCGNYMYAMTKRIYNGTEVETRKTHTSFQIIQVSFKAFIRIKLE